RWRSSLATKTEPSSDAPSTWTSGSEPGSARTSSPTASSPAAASANDFAAASSPSVEATTDPSWSARTAASICAEISVRSARACAASMREEATTGPRLHHHEPDLHSGGRASHRLQVPRRPWNASRGDDRLLRAPLVRPPPLPLALADGARRAADGVELPRRGATARLPCELGRPPPDRRPLDPGPGHVDRNHRRRRAPLGLAPPSSRYCRRRLH